MNKRWVGVLAGLLTGIAMTGCGEPKPNEYPTPGSGMSGAKATPQMSTSTSGSQANADSGAAMQAKPESTHEEVMKSMQDKYDALKDQIAALEKKVEAGSDDLKARFKNDWEPELKKKQELVQALLAKGKAATETEWAQMKKDLKGALDDIGTFYDQMVQGLK